MKRRNPRLLFLSLRDAHTQARKHKTKTKNVQKFEEHLHENISKLFSDLIHNQYDISPSIYFVQKNPVKREIFAGSFRDRVIHHLVFDWISPYREKQFIYDSYSCRKHKGTSLGVQRISKFMRACSNNYTKECRILKLDLSGYFMAIDKKILYTKCKNALLEHPPIADVNRILQLIHKIIFNDPTKKGIFKGSQADYIGLPHNKSLFHTKEHCGLPIGNLTSQLFSNIYLNDFDHRIKETLGMKYYGRYVDDFVIIHQDREILKSLIPQIRTYLSDFLHLDLHPNKIYLQHYSKGVKFLGAFIKPYSITIDRRTIGNFRKKLWEIQQLWKGAPTKEQKAQLLSVINSYLGFMKHYHTFKIRKKMLIQLLPSDFWEYFEVNAEYTKIEIKPPLPLLPREE